MSSLASVKTWQLPGMRTCRKALTMSHDQVAVKPEGSIDCQLVVNSAQQGWQPARLSRVHEQEHDIMLPDHFF